MQHLLLHSNILKITLLLKVPHTLLPFFEDESEVEKAKVLVCDHSARTLEDILVLT